ncbi:MAG: hypothetical protein J0L61_06760 [Planctomycetes bacterium]|nr:hypothetical protein [Planctomycetota bacterium]
MASLAEIATRHMAAGVEDLDELTRLCERDTGKAPSLRSLMSYRSNFRRHGADWLIQRDPEAKREASRRYVERNREAVRQKSRDWHSRQREESPTKAREANRRWYEANRGKAKEMKRQWSRENIERAMLGQARSRARRRGQECTLTEADVGALIASGACAVTGLPFVFEWDGPSVKNPWAPSLDRLDVSLGYVSGNVRAVCWIVNHMRCDYPDEVLAKAARAIADAMGA